jgi:NAD(P)-dependent dehydrogenase (short-subunit alcohol dehydrogenase family)
MDPIRDRHRGKHVVVTGAGSGIGRAIALRLAGEGAKLSLLARDLGRLRETASKAGQPDAFVAACDIRERAEVDATFAAAAKKNGPLHALVANSGIGGANENGPLDRFDDLVATNLVGTYSCFRAAERHLAPAGATRHLVAIASILARIGVAGYTGYCASKAGILGLVRALAMELAGQNVQVNAICPGWVETDMALEGLGGMAAAMGVGVERAREIALSQVPLGRMSAPEDVAGFVAWLLSDDARGVTGQALDMNNGAFMI